MRTAAFGAAVIGLTVLSFGGRASPAPLEPAAPAASSTSTSTTVLAAADTYTRSDQPRQSFGTSERFSAEGSSGNRRHGLLSFVVPAPAAGSTITKVTLRAFSESASSGRGVAVFVTGNEWTENGVTWSTEPPRGERIARTGGYQAKTWVEWPVTSAVPAGGGVVSLRLQTREAAWLGFDSRENPSGRAPRIVVTTTSALADPPCAPSGVAMPVGDLPGWTQVFADDFETEVPIGRFPGAVYGSRWGSYPDGWHDTTGRGTYMPSKVLSVRDCALDYYIHTERGVHMVAAPTPKVPVGAYGRYELRFRAASLHGYKTAWLLWPDSGLQPDDGEIDWPEGNLDGIMKAYHHYADPSGGQDWFHTDATYARWHTATTIWEPGRITFLLDGQVFGTSTKLVPDKPMHWVLQTETSTDGSMPDNSTAGHVRIDWVVAYKASTHPSARVSR
jgi:hypothetical protein